ncbi:O-antigen polysaccharide polymerase Wzy [Winogradskyella sp. HB-48]|uniref:O-antigen polysaccharide polymerase Wzy n=1 Tax=Winogradskyella sp. HB-48 TaxID=3416808 RepID=UPI003CEBD14C
MSTFTHIDASFSEIIDNPYLIVESYIRFGGISTAYSSLHYDSYANIMATVDYVGKEGMSFGFQLIGALLFFIPRSLWASKPLSTGELIGNHLIDDFGFTYNNLSNSMVSEGYINFGFLGVIFFALLLSYFVVFFLKWLRSSNCLKEAIAFYFAIHLIFILRGDLTNAYTYFIGPFIAMYLIPDFFRRLFIKKRK